jgi:endonuclease/exonuclease/phosphatase family metal-dependent hydrolase
MFWYNYRERPPPPLILPQEMPTETTKVNSTQIQEFLEEIKKPRKAKIPYYVEQQQKAAQEDEKKEIQKQKVQRARAKAKKIAQDKKKQIEFEKNQPKEEDDEEEEEFKEMDKKKFKEEIRNSMKLKIKPVIQTESENEFKLKIQNVQEIVEEKKDPSENVELYCNQKELPKYLEHFYFSSECLKKKMFRCENNIWSEFETQKNLELKELKISTFNVWFDRFYFSDRVNEIINILKSSSSHIICLQEVTAQFINLLAKNDWIQKECYISDYNGTCFNLYGLMTISTVPIESVSIHTFPTMQGRNAQILNLNIFNKKVSIANVHLESLNSRDLRETQLFLTQQFVQNSDFSIILGDFNFDSKRNYILEETPLENDVLKKYKLENYLDAWEFLNPNDPGFTFDSENNSNIEQFEQMRYDRILVKKSEEWKLESMELIGNRYISDEIPIYPSDHFGLVLTLSH